MAVTKVPCYGERRTFPRAFRLLSRTHQPIAVTNHGDEFIALLVEELCFWVPVNPSCLVWPVGELDKNAGINTGIEQMLAYLLPH